MPMSFDKNSDGFDDAGIWLPFSATSEQIRLAVKQIIHQEGLMVRRLFLILDSSSQSQNCSFSDIYWTLRGTYKMALAAMTVNEGLKIDLHAFIYPDYANLQMINTRYEGIKWFVPSNSHISSPDIHPTEFYTLANVDENPGRPFKSNDHFDKIIKHSHEIVALGGTFDHLHAGHKLMISSAVLLAKSQVVIGLTDASMLDSKKLKEILMSYQERYDALMNFALIFVGMHEIKVDIVKLFDAFGPTITTPDINVLVVSEETLPGAEHINRIRTEKGMLELLIVPVEFVKLSSGERISSSLIRSQHSSPH